MGNHNSNILNNKKCNSLDEDIEYLTIHTSLNENEIKLLKKEVFKKERLSKKEFTAYFCKMFPR